MLPHAWDALKAKSSAGHFTGNETAQEAETLSEGRISCSEFQRAAATLMRSRGMGVKEIAVAFGVTGKSVTKGLLRNNSFN